MKNENREDYKHIATTPNMQVSFLHLEKLQAMAHHGCGGWPSSWVNPLPDHSASLRMQYTELRRHGLETRVTPGTCPTPKGFSFPCILKSFTTLTLQRSNDMPRDKQRSKSHYPYNFYRASSVTAAASYTGACNLPGGKTLWTLTSTGATLNCTQTPWHRADATSLVQWTWSLHLDMVLNSQL